MSEERFGTDPDLDLAEPVGEPFGGEAAKPADDNRYRWIVWIVLLTVFAGFALLRQVTTNLGVEAPVWDKSGREYVWRIWWRSRHEIVDFGPAWGFTLVYIALALAFSVLSALAVWVALVPSESPPTHQERPTADLAALQ